MTKQQAIDEITRRLVDYFHPERIYLFGSVARGDDGPDSDLDFGVVLPDDAPTSLYLPGVDQALWGGWDCCRRGTFARQRLRCARHTCGSVSARHHRARREVVVMTPEELRRNESNRWLSSAYLRGRFGGDRGQGRSGSDTLTPEL